MINPMIAIRVVIAFMFAGFVWCVYWLGYHEGRMTAELVAAQQADKLRQKVQLAQEAARKSDAALLIAQASAAQARIETVIKKEVIYRDKIKVASVASCVSASGLLDLYDASLGVATNP